MHRLLILALSLASIAAEAQTAQPRAAEPEVHTDRTITFRYSDKQATKVAVLFAEQDAPIPMAQGDAGLWTLTTPAMPPESYAYWFVVDGRRMLDPRNVETRSSSAAVANTVLVPGGQSWEQTAVPHGVVSHHVFTSKIVQGLPEGQDEYDVYTPPGYDARGKTSYPVLYLLHGWSQSASDWVDIGFANNVFDNLIAAGKVKPMIVVMPTGYGDMSFLRNGFGVWRDKPAIVRNVQLFGRSLHDEVMPRVEAEYLTTADRNGRAIAGLSMGGLESLTVGLADTKDFAWIGGFSGVVSQEATVSISDLTAKDANLKLLWIACGTGDDLITGNRDFSSALKAQGLQVTEIETPGAHTWLVWRDNLVHFAPLLFKQ